MTCTCDLETGFMVCKANGLDDSEGWVIIDAECVNIGRFKHRKYAELVVWALSLIDDPNSTVCVEHSLDRIEATYSELP